MTSSFNGFSYFNISKKKSKKILSSRRKPPGMVCNFCNTFVYLMWSETICCNRRFVRFKRTSQHEQKNLTLRSHIRHIQHPKSNFRMQIRMTKNGWKIHTFHYNESSGKNVCLLTEKALALYRMPPVSSNSWIDTFPSTFRRIHCFFLVACVGFEAFEYLLFKILIARDSFFSLTLIFHFHVKCACKILDCLYFVYICDISIRTCTQ